MPETLKIYNNLIRRKEVFKPLEPGKVKYYSCGPTTYDFVHVGNGRALIIGDIFHRVFEALGYEVSFVRNYTDVDDKIIERAQQLGVSPLEHAARFVDEVAKDMDSLGMEPADYTPKVSETIPEIIEMIKTLIEKGFAYEVNGEVLYHVPKFKDYGKLSKKDLESLEHGRRVEVESHKKDPADFVLWKPDTSEASWDSPWGRGRPGWHIECSAMAKKFLGDSIDLHHGGVDLMFPHHENEIAQSEAANGCQFSGCWCHHEFVNFGSIKMSKSLGNVVTIRAFVEKFSGEVLRQMFLTTHYRSVVNWNEEAIERAINDSERLHSFLINYEKAKTENTGQSDKKIENIIPKMKEELANDFNTPGALSHLFALIRSLNKNYLDENSNYKKKEKLNPETIAIIDEVIAFSKQALGCFFDNPEGLLIRLNISRKELSGNSTSDEEVEVLLVQRKEARENKDWDRADKIRDRLKELKVVVKDNPDGTTTWSYE